MTQVEILKNQLTSRVIMKNDYELTFEKFNHGLPSGGGDGKRRNSGKSAH